MYRKRSIKFRPNGNGAPSLEPPDLNRVKSGKPNLVTTTRFTLITWLPKSLFAQFKRVANIYFLFVSILVFFPWSPHMWSSTVTPFVSVLLWTALKDMYEDHRRKRDDDAENSRRCLRFNAGAENFEEISWKDLLCGDIVWITADEAFPADLLLLRASGGQAFISTVNLDGETNLKERSPPELSSAFLEQAGQTGELKLSMVQLMMDQGLQIDLDEPKIGLTDMGGNVSLKSPTDTVEQALKQLKVNQPDFLHHEHFLPRGCVLRNTPWILTVAAYVGDDTKTRLNVADTSGKISNMQNYLNRCVQGLVFFLFIFCIYAGIMALAQEDVSEIAAKIRALPSPPQEAELAKILEEDFTRGFFINFLIYWIILYQIVPISLYVCFETVKLALGFQINFDKQMVDSRTGQGAMARTADLVEELGQVDFIFSDKTGTLTENEMVFARACIQGTDLGDFRAGSKAAPAAGILETQRILANSGDELHAEVKWFFVCLASCHSAQVDIQDDGVPHYSGSSPDEVTFLEAGHAIGISFQARRRLPGKAGWELRVLVPCIEECDSSAVNTTADTLILSAPEAELQGSTIVVKPEKARMPSGEQILSVFCEIPFTSERKRMSIICEHKGDFVCITKGADNVISALCDEPFSEAVAEQLLKYSKQGLRTLAIASKIVDREFVMAWQQKLAMANIAQDDRERQLAEVAAEMEHSLLLSGISAIEDRLQPKVPEAIDSIKAAGIRFWVLTGDKIETAVEIVRACRLFTADMVLAYMVNATSEEHALQMLKEAKKMLEGRTGGGLIIDGTFTKFVLGSVQARSELYRLALSTTSCVCCRLSPAQKRKLVELVKIENPRAITLAIGDGANDVSMIQGAHIGIGVRGKEGNQAVQASDVAISQFSFIVPLLFCHGRRAYRRVAQFLCYYIYKHIVLATADVIWAHQFQFLGEIAYPEWLSSAYNVFFTSLPVMVILSFDRDMPDSVAVASPGLYVEGLLRTRFNYKVFTLWMISGVWHGTLAWAVPCAILGTKDFFIEEDSGVYTVEMVEQFWVASCTSFTLVVLFVDLRLWMVALNKLAAPTITMLFMSVVCFFAALFVLDFTGLQPQISGVPVKMLSDSKALLCIFLTPLALVVDMVLYYGAKIINPSPLDKARWALKGKQPEVYIEANE